MDKFIKRGAICREGEGMAVKTGIAVAALVLTGAAAQADVAAFQGLFDCGSSQTQAAISACASMNFTAAESDLHDAYAAALLRMNALDQQAPVNAKGAAAALQAAEQAWVAYRDLGCSAEGLVAPPGVTRVSAVLACKARLASDRSVELWTLSGGP